ncbi:TolB family protein [Nocardioides stalactiti]|uniref:TolB family protein n=1 Tax=Nocardioides stalactiti TaxID=2755356 RepID=UPI0016027410|nr:PD40 domain-containing protein [Nocardioides stalactiti]
MRKLLPFILLCGALAGVAPATPVRAAAAAPASDGLLLVGGSFTVDGIARQSLATTAVDGRFPALVGESSPLPAGPEATFAPDGTTFATLGSTAAGRTEVVVRRTLTNEVVRRVTLLARFTDAASPRFSPDGTRVALAVTEQPNPDKGQSELCGALISMRLATSATTVLRGGQAACHTFEAPIFDWSSATVTAPDGRFVWPEDAEGTGQRFLRVWRPGAAVETLDVTVGSGLAAGHPRWSPDASKIAMVMGGGGQAGHLYVVDAGTGAMKRLVGPKPEDYTNEAAMARTPEFSPDGSRIAYVYGSFLNANAWSVRTVPVGGGTVQTLFTSRPDATISSLRGWQPVAAPVTGPPPSLAGLSLQPDDRRIRLSWTAPTVADYYRLVVFRSTTGFTSTARATSTQQVVYSGRGSGHLDFGTYPLGYGPDGWYYGYVYGGERKPLKNGTTYYYSAFVVDTAGEVSAAAHASATPGVLGAESPPGAAGQIRYIRNTGSEPETAEIWSMNADGTRARRLRQGSHQVLSPDGTQMLYVNPAGLYRAAADGSNPVRLAVHGYGGNAARIYWPTWSPDSSTVAFVRSFQAATCGGFFCFEESVFTVPAAGGAQDLVVGTGELPAQDYGRRTFAYLTWGPALDGYPQGRLAFTETYHCPSSDLPRANNCSGTLHLINPDGSEQAYVGIYGVTGQAFEVFFDAPSWSPDGKYLAFQHTDQQGDQSDTGIRVVKVDGTEQRVLVDSAAVDESAPSWSADGQRIVYVRYDRATLLGDIWDIAVDRTGARNLTRTPAVNEGSPQATSVPNLMGG